MKIYKLAAGIPPVPEGMALVKVTIRPDGSIRKELIRGGKSECTDQAARFLEDLLNTEISGFEGMSVETDDEGKTDEFYEQQASKKPRSRPHRLREKEEMDAIPPVAGPQQETRELDTGFGVGD